MLKGLRQTPVASDKNSGYTLLSDSDVRNVLLTVLESEKYVLLDGEELRLRKYRAADTLTSLAKRLSVALGDTSITNAVQKSSWAQNATEVAQIQLRCKSQKEPGQVWFRVITGNAVYRYISLALWVAG